MNLPAHLTTGEYAAAAGLSKRTVQRMVAAGDFPPGSVIHVGTGRHYRPARLLTAKLRAAGWLPEQVSA